MLHIRDHRLNAMKDSLHIDIKAPVKIVFGHFHRGLKVSADSGPCLSRPETSLVAIGRPSIVDQAINLAVVVVRSTNDGVPVLTLSDVQTVEKHAPRHARCKFAATRLVEVSHADFGTFLGEAPCNGCAKPSGST